MNKYSITSQDYGDEDKIFMVYEVWDENLNIVVSAHDTQRAAENWIVEQGQINSRMRELSLAVL